MWRPALFLALAASVGCGSTAGNAEAPSPVLRVPADRALRAAFLVVDGVYNTELMAPWDVLQHTAHLAAPRPGIDVFTVSPDGGEVRTAEGLRVLADHSFSDAPPFDILVVPSAEGSRDADRRDGALVRWVHEAGREAQVVMSLCWGAFILAEAGLLDDAALTTFPGDYARFAEAFPDLDLRVNVSFVHDGRVLTSQGGARSYDAAMYLVDLLYGPEVAARVGAGLLLPWPPSSEAPHFISDPSVRVELGTEGAAVDLP